MDGSFRRSRLTPGSVSLAVRLFEPGAEACEDGHRVQTIHRRALSNYREQFLEFSELLKELRNFIVITVTVMKSLPMPIGKGLGDRQPEIAASGTIPTNIL